MLVPVMITSKKSVAGPNQSNPIKIIIKPAFTNKLAFFRLAWMREKIPNMILNTTTHNAVIPSSIPMKDSTHYSPFILVLIYLLFCKEKRVRNLYISFLNPKLIYENLERSKQSLRIMSKWSFISLFLLKRYSHFLCVHSTTRLFGHRAPLPFCCE